MIRLDKRLTAALGLGLDDRVIKDEREVPERFRWIFQRNRDLPATLKRHLSKVLLSYFIRLLIYFLTEYKIRIYRFVDTLLNVLKETLLKM